MIRCPPCSRSSAQAVVSSSSRHIAPTPRAAMPRRSSVNQERWRSSPPPRPPTIASSETSTPLRRTRGMSVRVAVGEGRVVDDLHAGRRAFDQEQRGQAGPVHQRPGHDDEHRRDVAVGHEPLLAVQAPAVLGPGGGGGDAGGIRAGVLLGHRVGVVELAAQGGDQVALDLVGRPVGEDVVGAGNVPGERVGGAAELLLDQEPLDVRPALPAVLGGVQAAAQPPVQRLATDLAHPLLAADARARARPRPRGG